VEEKLDMTRQCALADQQASCTLGCIPSSGGSKAREGILSLFSTRMRPSQDSCIQLWSPQHMTDMDLLEQVLRKATKMV